MSQESRFGCGHFSSPYFKRSRQVDAAGIKHRRDLDIADEFLD